MALGLTAAAHAQQEGMKALDMTGICARPDTKATMADPKTGRSWEDCLADSIQYPKKAEQYGVSGRVVYLITIDNDGSIRDATVQMLMLTDAKPEKMTAADKAQADKVNQALKQELVKEGLRCMKLLPKCKPGMKDGKPVRTKTVLAAPFWPKKKG